MTEVQTSRAQDYGPVTTWGLATTAITLFGVWLLAPHVAVLGFYLSYVIPIGAILVGALAGSGYALGSLRSGIRATNGLLWAIVLIQACAFVLGSYLEFRQLVSAAPNFSDLSFWNYVDQSARTMSFSEAGRSGRGSRLGVFGYAFKLLDLVGFASASVIPLLILRHTRTYCEACGVYRKRSTLGVIEAGVKRVKIPKDAPEEVVAEHSARLQAGVEKASEMTAWAEAGDWERVIDTIRTHAPGQRAKRKLMGYVDLRLEHCPSCEAATLFGDGHVFNGQVPVLAVSGAVLVSTDPSTTRALLAAGSR